MTNQEALKILRQYNAWRRDDEGVHEMPDPKEYGKAIDTAIEVLERFDGAVIVYINGNDIMAEIKPDKLAKLNRYKYNFYAIPKTEDK